MNEPTPAWIDWGPGPDNVTWGMGEQPFPDERLAPKMENHWVREATIAGRPKTKPQRVCLHPGCTTVLNRYNRDDFCGTHIRAHRRLPVSA